jgi:hypothetical protein
MNTLTLSLPLIASLKSRIDAGYHLHTLFAINEYVKTDPTMARTLLHYLAENAAKRANHKVKLIAQFKESPLAALTEEDQLRMNELFSFERESAEKSGWRGKIIPLEGRAASRRPLRGSLRVRDRRLDCSATGQSYLKRRTSSSFTSITRARDMNVSLNFKSISTPQRGRLMALSEG